MSLRALLEIVVHLESFRNIDLFFQGLYYLKVTLYNKKNDELYYANPYCVFASKISQEKQKKLKGADHHHLIPAQIAEDQSAFMSRSFLIRYCEEEVEINDIGLFRAEVDVEPEYLNTTFHMDIELFFSDLNALGGPDKWQQHMNDIENKAVFKSVSIQRFKIHKLAQGVSEFLPVIFEDQYFSSLHCLVQTTLLDFRFRVRQFKNIQSDIASFQERGILVKTQDGSKKQDVIGKIKTAKDDQDVLMTQNPSDTGTNNANGQWQFKPNNVAEFFFADDTGEMPKELNMKEVDLLYNDYIRVMTCMHERLRNIYNTYVTKFLDENQRKENFIEPETARLILPGEDEDLSKMFEQQKQFDDEEIKEDKFFGQGPGHPLIKGDVNSNINVNRMALNLREEEGGNESMYNIDDTNESFSERKNQTNIPSLKNNKNAMNKATKPFSERLLKGEMKIDPNDPQAVANQMIFEINLLAGKMLILQHKMIDVLKVCPRFITEFHHFEYKEKMRDKWGESIFREVVPTSDFSIPSEENIGETHKKFAKTRRANILYQDNDQLKIEDQSIFGSQSIHPIIFEECYVKDDDPNFVRIVKNSADLTEQKLLMSERNGPDPQQNYMQDQLLINIIPFRGVHLFVLVHGFQGNSCDMRLLKNNLSLMHPDAIFLVSSANEDQTEGDIFEMGERLANEVKQYIQSFCPVSCLARISFIGYSLGGVIVRTSLPHLEEFKDKFYSYMSLSSPHLSYMYNSNKLFDAGMWFLKKWRKSKCLQQLSMTDAKNMEDTFIYKLSCSKGLGWFKNVALVSSYQDQYAPFDSARIQICKRANDDAKKGNVYIKMAQNVLENLSTRLLYRLDVNFKINDKNLDSFIGRTAHIQFLECQPLMKMIVYRYREFFS